VSEPIQAAADALLADVDPAFRDPARPALRVQNVPAPGEVEALLADRRRLMDFLTHGHRLFRDAVSRQTPEARTRRDPGTRADGSEDESFGQRSNADAQRATLDFYTWAQHYAPCLILLVDRALLNGAIEQEWRDARSGVSS
jgi:hypothetical protein